MSIFTSKKVWKFLVKIQLTKPDPKRTGGWKVPCLVPIRVKRAKNQFTIPHYLSLLWIFSIVCNVIVHHNNYILIGYSVFMNNLVGMAYVSLMPIIPITIAPSNQNDPDFSAIGNFIFRRQIWTLYIRKLK